MMAQQNNADAAYIVELDIPCANLCDVEVLATQPATTVAFAAEPRGGPESLWFCFRLRRSAGATPHVDLVLKHVETMLGLWPGAVVRPVIRYEGGTWQRTEAGQTRWLHDGRGTIAWTIAAPQTYVDVAFCYPYGPAELDRLAQETGGCWRRDVIGISQGGRGIERLSNDSGSDGGQRAGVYIIARQHSGESPGSWVLDGLLRRVAAMGEAAPLVWAVPFSNIDGVVEGWYGKDNFPYDLNRAWGQPPMRHETLVLQGDLWRWRKRCRPAFVLDLHAPSGAEGSGCYVYVKPAPKPEVAAAVQRWASRLAAALGPYASPDFAKVATYASRWETPTLTEFGCVHMEVPTLSMETSYQAAGDLVLTVEHYQKIGQRLAESFNEECLKETT